MSIIQEFQYRQRELLEEKTEKKAEHTLKAVVDENLQEMTKETCSD